jgi:hypothetical protein
VSVKIRRGSCFALLLHRRVALHRVTEKWLGHESEDTAEAAAAAAKRDSTGIAEPRHMVPGELNLRMVGETSQVGHTRSI